MNRAKLLLVVSLSSLASLTLGFSIGFSTGFLIREEPKQQVIAPSAQDAIQNRSYKYKMPIPEAD